MTRGDAIANIKEGTVVRFQLRTHVSFDPSTDTDNYDITYHQGVITRVIAGAGTYGVMYQIPGDILPRTEFISIAAITHVLVELT